MRLLVTGSRDWTDQHMICSVLDGLYTEEAVGHLTVTVVDFILIEGGAPGADTIAGWWADNSPMHSHNERPDEPYFQHLCFPAHWRHTDKCPPGCSRVVGKPAGVIRNQQMLDEGKPDLVVAFHDDLAASKGTRDMVERAAKAGLPVWHLHHYAFGQPRLVA